MQQLKALVAHGECAKLAALKEALAVAGYQTLPCDDGHETVRLTMVECPDVLLVDLRLPPVGGLEVLRRLRLHSSVPIVVLGEDPADATLVHALDLGADDYVLTPCRPAPLLARLRAVLRRLRPPEPERRQVMVVGDMTVDLDQHRLFVQGREVLLSPTEWQLLVALATNAGRLLQHEDLLTRTWGPEYRHDRQYLRVWIRRLRRKLEDDSDETRYIRTVPGVGYVFDPPLAQPTPHGG